MAKLRHNVRSEQPQNCQKVEKPAEVVTCRAVMLGTVTDGNAKTVTDGKNENCDGRDGRKRGAVTDEGRDGRWQP